MRVILEGMERSAQVNRYRLVAQSGPSGAAGAVPRIRRYRLARLAPSPRSALGEDRHERLERAASSKGPRRG